MPSGPMARAPADFRPALPVCIVDAPKAIAAAQQVVAASRVKAEMRMGSVPPLSESWVNSIRGGRGRGFDADTQRRRGTQKYVLLRVSASKQPVLFPQSPEAPDIRNGEGDAEEGFVTDAGVDAAELDANPAAVGVVGELRGRVAEK